MIEQNPKNRAADLGQDPVGPLLVRLALPAICAQVANLLYNIADRIYFAVEFTMAFQNTFQQCFVALGEARISLFLAIERKVLLLIPLILILPQFFEDKLLAVFLAELVADLAPVSTKTILFAFFPAYPAEHAAVRAKGIDKIRACAGKAVQALIL